MELCQYVGYLTKNDLLIKPNLCLSRHIYFCHFKSHVSLLPLILFFNLLLSILAVEDNNQIVDPPKFKLLIFLAITVAVGTGY